MRISDWSSDVCSSDLRKTLADQRHRAVANLGRAERLGVEAACLLDLERGLLRDAIAGATADDIEAGRVLERGEGRRPVERPGAIERVGKRLQRGAQRGVPGPVRADRKGVA